jgi:predicted nucleic acid-binding protein
MFTLDTNILIGFLNDEERIVRQLRLWREDHARFFISVVSHIEVLALPKLTPEATERIERFLQEFSVIPVDVQLAKIAATIRREYRLGLGDSIITATAKLTDSTLVTRDQEILKKAKRFLSVRAIQ